MVTLDYTVRLCLTKLKTKQTYKKEREAKQARKSAAGVHCLAPSREVFRLGVGVSLLVPQLLAIDLLILKTERG